MNFLRIHLHCADQQPKETKHCNNFNSILFLDTVFLHIWGKWNAYCHCEKPLLIAADACDAWLTSPTLLNAKPTVPAITRASPRSGIFFGSAEKKRFTCEVNNSVTTETKKVYFDHIVHKALFTSTAIALQSYAPLVLVFLIVLLPFLLREMVWTVLLALWFPSSQNVVDFLIEL